MAENAGDAWVDQALTFLVAFAATTPKPFLCEDVRGIADHVIGRPHNAKAWGQVMRKAAKEGYVQAIGYAPANSSNRSPKVLWKRP